MANNTGQFDLQIRAVDQTSSVFGRINARLEQTRKNLAATQAPMIGIRSEMEKLGKLSGLTTATERMRRLRDQSSSAARNVTLLSAGLLGIGGIGSVAGVTRMVSAFGQWGTRISTTSRLLGVNVGQLNRLRNAAEISGAAPEDVDSSIRGIQDRQRAARNGDGQAARLLGAAGIGLNDRPEIAFNRALRAIARFTGTPEERRALMSALGVSESLDGLSREMDRYLDRAGRISTLTDEQARRAELLGENQRELTIGLRDFGQTLIGNVAQALTPVLSGMTEWLVTNREWLNLRIGDAFRQFGEWIKGIDFRGIIEGVGSFFKGVNDTVEALGGWRTVLTAVIGLKVGSWVLGVLGAVTSLTSALGLLAGSAGLPILARLIPALGLGALGIGAGMVHDAVAPGSYAGRSLVQGGLYGAGVGAAVGSIVPGIGTAVGGFAGGVIGAVGNGLYQNWGGSGTGGRNPTRAASARGSAGATQAYRYFLSRGLTPQQAAGLVANLETESDFDPNAVGDGGRAYGIAQWHPDRQREFARIMGRDIRGSSLEQQLEFVLREMQDGREGLAGRRLGAAGSAGDAGEIVSRYLLRPGATQEARDREAGDRRGRADWWLAQLAGGRPGGTGGAQTAGQVDININVDSDGRARVDARSRGDVNTPRIGQAMPFVGGS